MKTITKTIFILLSFAAVLCLSFNGLAKGPGGGNSPGGGTELDYNEETHLRFMRAEEKLAHDVYLLLGVIYPDYAFVNLTASETNHTEAMIDKLLQFGLDDLNENDEAGEFAEANYGEYFTDKYAYLTEEGKKGLLEALMVGALIEELDMHDIILCPLIIVDTDNGVGLEECGLNYTDEKTLINSYENLVEGSENHLRAFVRQIESTFPDQYPYQAQYLPQWQVNEILGR